MKWLTLISVIILTLSAYPSSAQNNDPNNIRIISQSSTGLAYPSSSYIGAGTLSKTAQEGAGYIPQPNPALPKVNRGAYIGTPGDNLYSSQPDLAQPLKPVKVLHGNRVIYKQTAKETTHTYVPDPNIPMTYSDFPTEQSIKPESTNPTVSSDSLRNDTNRAPTENK